MNRIFKNTSSLFSAHLIGRLASLVITVWLMPRYFTETEFGGYFIAIALTNLIASLTELGMQNPLIREMTLHLDQTRHYLGNALIVRSLLSIVAYAIMLISGIFLYTTEIVTMIVFLGLAEIVNSIAQLYRCVFRAHEEIKYEAFTVVAERGVFFLIGRRRDPPQLRIDNCLSGNPRGELYQSHPESRIQRDTVSHNSASNRAEGL